MPVRGAREGGGALFLWVDSHPWKMEKSKKKLDSQDSKAWLFAIEGDGWLWLCSADQPPTPCHDE